MQDTDDSRHMTNIELRIKNTDMLWALASVDGEDVSVTYFN